MPPKGPTSSINNKRKASSPDSGDFAGPGPTKKGKNASNGEASASAAREGFASNGQPTNKILPVKIEFPVKNPETLRIATWNVSGLAACMKKGFKFYAEAEDADILILTETKMNDEPQIPVLNDRYPHRYWSIASKKGYCAVFLTDALCATIALIRDNSTAGTAVLSKHKPMSVTKTIPDHPDAGAVKGRIVTLEFETFYLVATYVTNAGQGLKTLPEKEEWNKHFTTYIRELDTKKPVIWTGDLNVAPTEKDLTHAKRNWNKQPGYTESETKAYAQILDPSTDDSVGSSTNKFLDIWRELHPNDQHYTYFGYRFDCRSKGIGWRLDMFVLSERLRDSVKMCEIRSEIYGASDHCPVVMEIEGLV